MNSVRKIAVYGAGGFAREVAWLISVLAEHVAVDMPGFIDDGDGPSSLHGKPVMSWRQFVSQHGDSSIIIAVGKPGTRRHIASKCREAGFSFSTVMHPSVQMSKFVQTGDGVVICCGCILTVDISIGDHVHVNLDCTIGHDVHIGEFSTLSPGVHVSGNVHIGKDVYVGTGASIINGTAEQPLIIGDGAVIGAGACVTRNVEPKTLQAGVPAQLKKRYT